MLVTMFIHVYSHIIFYLCFSFKELASVPLKPRCSSVEARAACHAAAMSALCEAARRGHADEAGED